MLSDRLVRVEALDTNDNLLTGATFRIFVNGEFASETENSKGFCTVQVSDPEADIEVVVVYESLTKKKKIAPNAETFPVYFDEVKAPMPIGQHSPISERAVFVSGIAFILLAALLAVFISEPTKFQWRVFGAILAIGVAAFGLGLSGMLNVKIGFGKRLSIAATGALGIFVIVYFFAPAQ